MYFQAEIVKNFSNMGKRGRSGSPMRKARKVAVDPWSGEEAISLALHDVAMLTSHVDVPGSKLNRKMLIEDLPNALGAGCALDERHGYQKIVADAIADVLAAEAKKRTEKAAASKAEHDEANAAKAVKDGQLSEKQGKLEEKKTEVSDKKAVHSADKQAHKDAEHALVEANSAVENFDGDMQKKEDDKAKYEAALNNTLASLKKGEHAREEGGRR